MKKRQFTKIERLQLRVKKCMQSRLQSNIRRPGHLKALYAMSRYIRKWMRIASKDGWFKAPGNRILQTPKCHQQQNCVYDFY